MPREPRRYNQLHGAIESLEERLAMTAQPLSGLAMLDAQADSLPSLVLHAADLETPPLELHQTIDELVPIEQHQETLPALEHHVDTPDFWRDTTLDDAANLDRQIEQLLSSAHGTTGWNNVSADYGFDGAGQTVVVIDSGIAYDHYALGGGFGSGYRVVGGWDFTEENDADPYDDANTAGTSASHGTHIAGIIGSDHATHTGVAPGVDLVALRVFNDGGAGYFTWVENALQWVHDNRDAFENPITTVNLSLGVSNWNASNIPSWANLEDEFAQLEQDGIFTTVSAGNSFTSYNTPGLSYPAASPYVVPVMSADDSGALSYYSQRLQRAIAAPGRGIVSTVPDFKGDNNGTTDDFRAKSGTSMAAPYLAGASVLIREAMEFVGQTGITQDAIFDHIKATADTLLDSATNLNYDRLNLEAAIDALMPADDYGSTEQTAYSLGTVDNDTNQNISGVISTLDDIDYFTFTADADGEVTFTTNSTSHAMTAQWTVTGGTWEADGENCVITVAAGQTYTVGLASSGGLGYFDVDVTAVTSQSSISYPDWGVVEQGTVTGIAVVGDGWYQIEASRDGFMTVQTSYNAAAGAVSLEVYDSDATTILGAGSSRVDVSATAGQTLYVRAIGDNPLVNFTMTNLVSRTGDVIAVAGTAGDDTITFRSGDTHKVFVNGVFYGFQTSLASTVQIDGAGGTDEVRLLQAGETTIDLTGVEEVVDLDALATKVDQEYNLSFTGNDYLDYGGWNERWLRGGDGTWYFITETGGFYRASGEIAESDLIVQLDALHYDNLDLLAEAATSAFSEAEKAASYDTSYGLYFGGDYYEDWGGWGEKWIKSHQGGWFFLCPDGEIYRWNGSSDLSTSTCMGQVDVRYFDDPSSLYNASAEGSLTHDQAGSLDSTLQLRKSGSYAQNWGGWNEKWMIADDNQWYFITESGALYQWNGSHRLLGSAIVATLDESFYWQPELLHDAALETNQLGFPAESAALASNSAGFAGVAQSVELKQQETQVASEQFESQLSESPAAAIDAAFSGIVAASSDSSQIRESFSEDRDEGRQTDAFDAALSGLNDDALVAGNVRGY